jgi:5-methylcytosine-specific restriction endonuclease McrA
MSALPSCPRPTPEQQLEFLQQIQHLFEDGDFVATYKFSLLMALAEIAVERGSDDGQPLSIPMSLIGEKFAELYWPQTLPYASGAKGTQAAVLAQSQGAQAAVVNALVELRQAGANNLARAKSHPAWPDALGTISRVVRQMPVQYLQNVGGKFTAFLYDYPPPRGLLVLKPGVAANLRTFHGLIQQLSRVHWMDHVRSNRLNVPIIGSADDLEHFMFGTSRQGLRVAADVLGKMQSGKCFYCGDPIRSGADVDHFIPWSRYPRDLAHNFVLAHGGCNRRKSDFLAAQMHLEHWMERNLRQGEELGGRMTEVGFVSNEACSVTVARWAYEQAMGNGGVGWVRNRETEAITDGYRNAFLD